MFRSIVARTRAPLYTAGSAAARRPTPASGGREALSDLRISESEIDVPDFLK